MEPLRGVLETAACAIGGRAVMRPKNKENGLETKAPSTAAAKAERDYGGDFSRVVDLIGGTCVLPDDGDYGEAVEAIRAALPEGASIAKVKKLGFGSPEACYQDVKVSIRFANGGIGEVILVSEHMQDAKFNRGGHAVYEITRIIAPLKETDKKIGAAWKALKGLSSAIYSGESDLAAFERAKAKASSALQALPLASMKASLSAEDMMVVKSSASLLKEAKPLSVSSAAIPSSSEIKKGISHDRVAKSASKVKNKLEQSAQKVKDEAPGADADGVLRVWLREQDHTRAARNGGSPSGAGDLLAELTMREYLRPLAATLKEAKERGESYADIKKRLAAPLTNAAALAHGLAAAFNTGRLLPQDESVAAANPYGCNQYGEGWAEPHDGNSTGYQQMGPGKPERKVLTTEHGGNKVEKVTHEKHPGKGAYEHADNDSLDKTAKEEREKREGEKLTAATARTPEELLKATGLPREGEATTEQVESFLNAMRNRYPENAKRFDELVTNVKTTIPGKAGREAVEHIREQLQGYMCMISPEVLDQLPQTRIEHRSLRDKDGYCKQDSSVIGYDKNANDETIIHEYTHLLHNSCENATFAEIANYFRERTKNNIVEKLEIGKALRMPLYGKSDHFALSFSPVDDYAGRIYAQEENFKRSTKNGVVSRNLWIREGIGVEMVTRHLQKLALPAHEFTRYWNDKREGKYMWREAFLVCANLLCKK